MTNLCTCGSRIGVRGMQQHRASAWHRFAREIRALRAIGLSYTMVALYSKSGLSRARIHQCLRGEESYRQRIKKGV